MPRALRALPALGLLVTLGLAGAVIGAGTAAATALPIGQCTTSSGVVLAVDFGHWGGPVLRACGSTPTTGYALLNQGGWVSTGTHHDGPGFICRIAYSGFRGGAAYPTATEQNCVNTPPTTAYWSYWHADRGQAGWTYSQDGAASYRPAAGSVELWTFGDASSTSQPSISPDAVRAHNSTPPVGTTSPPPPSNPVPVPTSPSSAPVAQPRSSAGGAVPAGAGSTVASGPGSDSGMPRKSSANPARSGPPSASRTGAAGRSSTTRAADGVSGSASSAPSVLDAQPVAAVRHRAGSARPVLLTAALVLVLGGAAGFTAWRRRQAH